MAKKTKKIKGRIIRIVDQQTVVVNLGDDNGITPDSVFYILGESEDIVDPESGETLGSVNVTKARVKATQVFAKFSIATTTWSVVSGNSSLSFLAGVEQIDEGPLNAPENEIKPWRARSETPVRVGDDVEVSVASE